MILCINNYLYAIENEFYVANCISSGSFTSEISDLAFGVKQLLRDSKIYLLDDGFKIEAIKIFIYVLKKCYNTVYGIWDSPVKYHILTVRILNMCVKIIFNS